MFPRGEDVTVDVQAGLSGVYDFLLRRKTEPKLKYNKILRLITLSTDDTRVEVNQG